jgi:hypothetical protein
MNGTSAILLDTQQEDDQQYYKHCIADTKSLKIDNLDSHFYMTHKIYHTERK